MVVIWSTYGSVYTAIDIISSFLQVAITLHAISPRFAISNLLIMGRPEASCSWLKISWGSFSIVIVDFEVVKKAESIKIFF